MQDFATFLFKEKTDFSKLLFTRPKVFCLKIFSGKFLHQLEMVAP
ncbi:hypothetical protein SLEP1_g49333 [Rubroshorea leprosula]|uniref:Ribosomal protein L32 n=1 Tax=Rubroshorea leprosula TaxID=152421 RepID=A0AAV5LYQ7_9ROSI|nr:hypothetical protein SLEP1_g49333 [Rubroshorea leprosula]